MSDNYYSLQLCKRTRNGADGRSKCVDEWCAPIYNIEVFNTNPRHDEGFDTAEVSYFTKGDTSIREWRKVRLWEGDKFSDWWVESYDSEQIVYGAEPVYRKKLKLIELTKVLEKRPMRNLNFSRNVDGTARYTMRSMLNKVIYHMFTVLEIDRDTIPLKIELDSTIQGLDNDAPEMFFTEKTALEIFIEIGEVLGGFPRLLPRNVETGKYVLTYDMWDNPNAARHTVNNPCSVTVHRGIEGFADIVESNVKNCISGDDKNYSVYPCEGEYKGVNAEEYEVDITKDNAVFTLPKKINKIIKVEAIAYDERAIPTQQPQTRDMTNYVLEYKEWQALPKFNLFNLSGSTKDFSMYYKQGENKIYFENLKNIAILVRTLYEGAVTGRSLRLRVAYIPATEISVKAERSRKTTYGPQGPVTSKQLPISQVVNQISNVIQTQPYGTYLQGLVNRMIGEYKVTEVISKKGKPLYKTGDYLNGEIITEAYHQHGYQYVMSLYTTSKEFNRRSQFVGVPCEVRQWQIPDDNKVSDTVIHYAEEVVWSLEGDLEKIDNSSLTVTGKALYLSNYLGAGSGNKPSLAYVAWKNDTAVLQDNTFQNKLYGLLSIENNHTGTAVMLNFGAYDNNSIGFRSYRLMYDGATGADNKNITTAQNAISYQSGNATTEYMQLKISNEAPTKYNFSTDLTGTEGKKAPTDTESITQNKTFDFTFPMSNKQQFNECSPLVNFSEFYNGQIPNNLFKIDKDLRDIIKFVYQLDNVGISGTILTDNFVALNTFCIGGKTTNFKIYLRKESGIGIDENCELFAVTSTNSGTSAYGDYIEFLASRERREGEELTEPIDDEWFAYRHKGVILSDESNNILCENNTVFLTTCRYADGEGEEEEQTKIEVSIYLRYDFRKKQYKCM